ncbi:MAG TPA: prepilin-type N-terminal cleavage/methylation domain-containing protein [Clostridiales bacterium]|nr:prepilin-type N-terminal cleavage/methylation domain-containing protein [Clostridiales bacterium]
MKWDRGFTLVEFVVSLFILSLLLSITYTSFYIGTDSYVRNIDDLEIQGNMRFAASFIHNMLLNSALDDIVIGKDFNGNNTLLIKKTKFFIRGDKLMVDHNYNASSPNPLADYITTFKVSNDEGLISVVMIGGKGDNRELLSITIKVYLGE